MIFANIKHLYGKHVFSETHNRIECVQSTVNLLTSLRSDRHARQILRQSVILKILVDICWLCKVVIAKRVVPPMTHCRLTFEANGVWVAQHNCHKCLLIAWLSSTLIAYYRRLFGKLIVRKRIAHLWSYARELSNYPWFNEWLPMQMHRQ